MEGDSLGLFRQPMKSHRISRTCQVLKFRALNKINMRAWKLHDSVLQRNFTSYIGEENPELPARFEPKHLSKRITPAKPSEADAIINRINTQQAKPKHIETDQEVRMLIEDGPGGPTDTQANTVEHEGLSLEKKLDFRDFVDSQAKQREQRKYEIDQQSSLVFRRMCALREPQYKTATEEQATSAYLRQLMAQIRRLQQEKLPIRVLYYKTNSVSFLSKLLALNSRLKPLLQTLFHYATGQQPTSPNQVALQLLRLRRIPQVDGVSTQQIMELLLQNMKDVLSEQRQQTLLAKGPVQRTR